MIEPVDMGGLELAETERANARGESRLVTQITEGFIASACRRLDEGKALRRALPPWGRIHIDRQLPFLVVYRRPARQADPDTDNLVLGEASYLLASGERRLQGGISTLVESVATTLSEGFGSFLTIEIWAASDADGAPGAGPRFRVFEPQRDRMASTIEVLARALSEVQIKGTRADVEVVPTSKISPPGLPALIRLDRMRERGWHGVGIEVRPVFRDQARGEDYPLVLRALHRGCDRYAEEQQTQQRTRSHGATLRWQNWGTGETEGSQL